MEEENLSGKEKKKGLAIFKKKEIWISGIIGLIIGSILIYVLGMLGFIGLTNNETLATFKGGKITDKELYDRIKDDYGSNYALELIDAAILEKEYKLTETQQEEIYNNAKELIDLEIEEVKYSYGITEEEYLEIIGYNTKEEYIQEYIEKVGKLEYRKDLYLMDCLKAKIPQEDIQNYYNENEIYGTISTKQMLLGISENMTEEENLKIANEIITKLNEGKTFDDVATEYQDKVLKRDFKFDSFNAGSVYENYVEASKALEKDTYTAEPVKTAYGYHIIYCLDKEGELSFEQAEPRIAEFLAKKIIDDDQSIVDKTFIELRKEKNLKIKDSKIKENYEKYCNEINGELE